MAKPPSRTAKVNPSSSIPFCDPYLVCALDVHRVDQVPVLVGHVLEADVPENTSIIQEDIDAAKGLDGGIDNLVAILDAVVIRYGLAASLFDFIDDDICGLGVSHVSLGIQVAVVGMEMSTHLC